jgi:putative SOS response-associated peptidase YedK
MIIPGHIDQFTGWIYSTPCGARAQTLNRQGRCRSLRYAAPICYSAKIVERWRTYLRETDAVMDLEEFERVYGARRASPGIRIPRAVDRWFDEPTTPAGERIKQLIDEHRAGMVTRLEQDIFTQRKRLADAERKLAQKETRAALESARIAADKVSKALRDLPVYKGTEPTPLDGRIFPFHSVPIIVRKEGRNVVQLARYHLRQQGKPADIDRKFPGLYNARRDNLTKFWRNEFAHTHALMLVESFYENVERDGRNAVLHFQPQPADTMLIACLYSQWQAAGETLLSFAAITDEPAPEVAAAGHDRLIINIKTENVGAWLTPEGRSPEELQAILSDKQKPYYDNEVLAA